MRPDRQQNDSDDRNSLDDQTNVQLDSFGSQLSSSVIGIYLAVKYRNKHNDLQTTAT